VPQQPHNRIAWIEQEMITALSVRNLRIIDWIEGITYLVLFGIAMPLNHLADDPRAVPITGMIHGVPFQFFCIALAWQQQHRSLLCSTNNFAFSLVPGAMLFMDRHLAPWDNKPIRVRN
jgi:integral membrane protein